jgi:hypothetical protein
MIESGNITFDLPELDRTDDPRGGAVAWALLMMSTVSVAGILLTALCVARGW